MALLRSLEAMVRARITTLLCARGRYAAISECWS
jgi:hypothetical protein